MRTDPGLPARFGLVFVGGAVGTLARYLLSLALPYDAAHPPGYAVLVANVLGSFLIGVLAAAPPRSDRLGAAEWRLLLGTGVLGGFTTYSAFTLDAFSAAVGYGDSATGWLVWFVLGQIVAGVAAALAGLAVGHALGRSRG